MQQRRGAQGIDLFQDAKARSSCLRHGHRHHGQIPRARQLGFRVQGRDAIQAPFIVDDIVKRGWNKVAILPTRPATARAAITIWWPLATKNLKPVYVGRFDLKRPHAELTAARAAGPT